MIHLGIEIDASSGEVGGCLIKNVLHGAPVHTNNLIKKGRLFSTASKTRKWEFSPDKVALFLK